MVNNFHFDDLTKIDKPFEELDDATKGALLLAAHLGEVIEFYARGWEGTRFPLWTTGVKYRVQPKPKPVIGEVVMHGLWPVCYSLRMSSVFGETPNYKLCVTFPTRDGQHVPGVYTSPDGLQIKIEVAK